MKIFIGGLKAVAQTVANCQPQVISAYPITPQTHVVEELAKLKSAGKLTAEYIRAESEFSAASIVLGAAATGVRTYTATSSQGLLLMTEVLFNIAGMRLPVVMTCANRSVSAPINIWNDQQDSLTVRDAGWQFWYAENNQEACDLHVQAFKVAESTQLPVIVNLDGFVLTHLTEEVDIPEAAKIKRFLPAYRPVEFLNPQKPQTFGPLVGPADYFEIRQELHEDLIKSQKNTLQVGREFKKVFGRAGNTLIDGYKLADAQIVLVSFGSVIGTMREVVDELRAKGVKVGILKIITYRPFPTELIIKALAKAKIIAVVEKDISLGGQGILATDLKAHAGQKLKAPISSFVVGLGGRDVTKETIKKIIKLAPKATTTAVTFVG
ncbi:MAG: transketolase C-terminal domain-containing protein [Candidatus Buchananbacteria bacterium]